MSRWPLALGASTLLLSSSLSSATSCVVHEKYPSTWSPPVSVPHRECPDISGTYWNEGRDASGETTRFFSDDRRTVTHFQIVHGGEESLKVLLFSGDDLVDAACTAKICGLPKNELGRDDYSCGPDGVTVPLGTHRAYDKSGGLAAVGTVTVRFTRDSEGNLIARISGGGIGFIFVFPIVPIVGSTYEKFLQKGAMDASLTAVRSDASAGASRGGDDP